MGIKFCVPKCDFVSTVPARRCVQASLLSLVSGVAVGLLCLISMPVGAQELTVESFKETLEPMTTPMQERDLNNDVCAIVKVILPVEGADFEGDFSHKFKTSEYWVYMSPGNKMLKVKCPRRVPLKVQIDEYIGHGVETKRIYELRLGGYPVDDPSPAASKQDTSQYLILRVTPRNAQVTIDGEVYNLDEQGMLSLYLPNGSHTYSISAAGYATQRGSVELRERTTLPIDLESLMATLSLTCVTPGVTFSINDLPKGTGSWTGELQAGTYVLKASKDGYRESVRTVTLSERESKSEAFGALEAITGSLNVNYMPIDAEVWIDGNKKGVSPDRFSGIMVGVHDVEIKKSGYVSASERVTVTEGEETKIEGNLAKDTGNKIAGHEYVDLGLSVKWATCNVGASSPEDYGGYYAWGETETKASYDDDNCETWEKKIGDIGGTSRDVAHVKWGGSWRLPTLDEIEELEDNCDYEWTTLNGVWGGKYTSRKNGNSIFLPAAGCRTGTSLYYAGEYGGCWSSTPREGGTQYACGLNFYSGAHDWYWYYRNGGRSVRPVSE